VIVSAYRKPGAALLVIYNTGKADVSVSVKVDGTALGLKASFSARVAKEGAPVAVRDGAFKLDLPGRGWQMVVVE